MGNQVAQSTMAPREDDLRQLLLLLPTRQSMEIQTSRLEASLHREIDGLKSDYKIEDITIRQSKLEGGQIKQK